MDIQRHTGFNQAKFNVAEPPPPPPSAFSSVHFWTAFGLGLAIPLVIWLAGLPARTATVATLLMAVGGLFVLWGDNRWTHGNAWGWFVGALTPTVGLALASLLFH